MSRVAHNSCSNRHCPKCQVPPAIAGPVNLLPVR
ncbi:transposase zinc-binding domain-containing protein [Sinorhizobium meliloti]|nr:transposase zinc-binding domain-containing protein [Sinorhizobium meliloti]